MSSDKLNMELKDGGGDSWRWRRKSMVRDGGRLMPSSGTKVSLSGRMRENSLARYIRRMSLRREVLKFEARELWGKERNEKEG